MSDKVKSVIPYTHFVGGSIKAYCGCCGGPLTHSIFNCPELERRARLRLRWL